MLTAARLREVLIYDPDNGSFIWRDSLGGPSVKGKPAGRPVAWGPKYPDRFYVRIGIDRRRYYAQVLAYLWMTGEMPTHEVDHRDGDGANNRWCNLRAATRAQNGRNRSGLARHNSSGFAGVCFHHGARRWRAYLTIDHKQIHLGLFDTPEEAAKARDAAAMIHHGQFAMQNSCEVAA
jgi:hypothetical protein